MTNQQFFALKNLQAPSDGKTHAIKWVTSVSATSVPSEFDFSNIGQNFESGFTPQAVYIDATQATGQVTLYETRTGFKIQVPVGDVGIFFALAVDYPVYQLLGNAGDAVTVIFLDFPAFPQGAAQQNLETVPGSVTVSNTPLPVSVPNPLPVIGQTGALTDVSGTIAAGGTSQVLQAAQTARKYILIQNISSGNLYINFTSAATTGTGSYELLPNGVFSMEGNFVSNEAINIIGATTGQAFTAKVA